MCVCEVEGEIVRIIDWQCEGWGESECKIRCLRNPFTVLIHSHTIQ